MAWTTPKTWAVGDPLTADVLNQHVRDNLNALKVPPTASYVTTGSYTTGTNSWTDVDATNLELTITTNGGDVLVHFDGNTKLTYADQNYAFDVDIDGTRLGNGIAFRKPNGADQDLPISFTRLVTGLSAGSHTFTLQWRVYAGGPVATLSTGAQFWVREVS